MVSVGAAGAITKAARFHRLDTEAQAATDDLVTINGTPADGDLLTLKSTVSSRTIQVLSTGNIRLPANFTLTDPLDRLVLQYDAAETVWIQWFASNVN